MKNENGKIDNFSQWQIDKKQKNIFKHVMKRLLKVYYKISGGLK